MTRKVTIASISIGFAALLIEEAVLGLLKSLLPVGLSNALMSAPVLLTVAVLLTLFAILLLWGIAKDVSQQEKNSREVSRRAWEATENLAALEEGHGKSLEAIKAQQDRLTALIEDAVAKLDQIASEREQSLQELKKEAGRHLHEAASVAAFPIKAELEEWKRGVLKAIGEEFEHRCPKTDQKSAS